jgi:hypothetical protein
MKMLFYHENNCHTVPGSIDGTTVHQQKIPFIIKHSMHPCICRLTVCKIYHMIRCMWTSHSEIMGINMEFVPFFAPFPLISKGFPLDVGTLDLLHSATRAFVRSGTDVRRLGLARSRSSNSSHRRSMGLRSGLCAGQSSSSTPITRW